MSVNNNAGLPVFEVFSDDRVVAGRFGQNDFIMTSGGNVGIGVGSPTSKLQVSGLVTANSGNFTNSLTVNNNAVWHSGNFDSSNIVRTNGDQTIDGVKTFDNFMVITANATIDFHDLGASIEDIKTLSLYGPADFMASSVSVFLPARNGELAVLSDITTTNIAGVLAVNKGGTGRSSYSNGQLLIGSGTSLVANTLTAGTGISITNGSGTITINSLNNVSVDDNTIVRTTGTQAISGYKTFNNRVTIASNVVPAGSQESQILLNGNNNNRIEFNGSGVGDPLLFSMSNGKKILLHPSFNTSTAEDFAIGIAGDGVGGVGTPTRFWQTIKDSASRFQWYAAATNIATLTGSGIFSTTRGLFSGDVTASGSFIGGSGTALLPSFEFVNDPDTGLFSPGTNTFAVSTSGVERLRVDSAGNIGIGTSSPSSRLQVSGLVTANSGNFTQSLQVNGTGVSISGHTHTASDITNFNSSVSGLLPSIANNGNNRILTSTGSSVGVNAEKGLTFDGSTLNVVGLPNNDPSAWGDPGIISASIENGPTTIVLNSNANNSNFEGGSWGGGVISLLTAESASSTPTLTITPFGFVFGDSTVQSSAWIGSVTSSQVTDFNSSVSGLLPTIANSGDNRVLTSTGSSLGINAENNLTFNGSLLSVTGSGSFSNNVTASGFIRSGGTSSQFLKADGTVDSNTFALSGHNQAESTITFTDITTGNATTSQHGYLPKLEGGTTNFLRADGSWATPPDTNTTYSNGTGLALNGTVFSVNYGTTNITSCVGNDSRLSDTRNTTNSLTVNDSGNGDSSSFVFNGSNARTLSYNSIGAPSISGTNATGTWNISVLGEAGTVSNGVYTTGDQNISGVKTFFNTSYFGNLSLSGNTLSSTTGNIIITPSTSGSLQRDSAGNPRGIYAVDWQSVRSTGTMVATGSHSVICGGINNSAVGSRSVVVGGGNNSALGNSSSINGGNTNTCNGIRSTIGGGVSNITAAVAENSTIGGGAFCVTSGIASVVAGGNINRAIGNTSTVAGGNTNTANGDGSAVGGGLMNIAGGFRSTVVGGSNNNATARFSTVVGGDGAKTTKSYEVAHSAGAFVNAGDAQHTILMAKIATNSTVPTNLLIVENPIERLTIPEKTTWAFTVKLSAYNNSDNLGAAWDIRGCMRRNHNDDTVLIGTNVVNQWIETGMAGTSAIVLAGNANEALTIQVVGLAGKDIRWLGVVDISQVSWGIV
jgi:hypothetical protein